MVDTTSAKKMSFFEKFTFAAGDLYGGGAQTIISFYYLIFLTDVIGIRPALAGITILVSRIWDAVNDPLMGIITDNTRTKYGRRRPYFFAGFFGIVASFILLWYPISSDSETVRFLFVLFSYLFYATIQTAVMVPYTAMSSEVSADPDERNSVNGLRLLFSQFATLLCAVLPIEIIQWMVDIRAGYITMSIVFGVFFAVPYIFMFYFTKERIPYNKDVKSTFSLTTFIEPFKVKTFRSLMGIYMCSFLAMDVVSSIFAYYMSYFLKRPNELNYVLGTMLVVQTLMVLPAVKIAKIIGKANTVKLALAFWVVGVLMLAFQSPYSPGWWIYANAGIVGLGIVGCIVMAWTMFPDVTDVGELAFKRRNAGSFGGIMTFMRRLSSAFGIFIVSMMLEFSGYVKPVQQVIDGATVNILQVQSPEVITALRFIAVGIPLILIAFTYFFAVKYPLNFRLQQRMNIQLSFERGLTDKGIEKEELAVLKKTLI